MKFHTAVLVGAGGIGSILVEPLTRLLMHHVNGTKKIFVIDGDVYEPHNATRQLFYPENLGFNKAVATANRLSFAPNLIPLPKYVDSELMHTLMQKINLYADDGVLLFIAAVDRHASRKVIIEGLTSYSQNFVLIMPSNEYETIQTSVYVHLKGKDLTLHPFKRYPDIATPQDSLPNSCGDQTPSFPQLIAANSLAAVNALLIVNSLLDDKPVPDECAGNIWKFICKPTSQMLNLS
jgi:hypothetical protein